MRLTLHYGVSSGGWSAFSGALHFAAMDRTSNSPVLNCHLAYAQVPNASPEASEKKTNKKDGLSNCIRLDQTLI